MKLTVLIVLYESHFQEPYRPQGFPNTMSSWGGGGLSPPSEGGP